MKGNIVVFTDYFLPSKKGGGPIQSITNLVVNLSPFYNFQIITSNKDVGENEKYQHIVDEKWYVKKDYSIMYIDRNNMNIKYLTNLLGEMAFDFVYLNSFFSHKFSVLINLTFKKNYRDVPIILAPRGELSNGALGLKKAKKRLFIIFAKTFGLYKKVIWHATAETEKREIEGIFGQNSDVRVASNLIIKPDFADNESPARKETGYLSIVFISRIHPKKNLLFALMTIKKLKGYVKFNIYGPIEDEDYWNECRKVIRTLPTNVKVEYKGLINHKEVFLTFRKHDVFFFPTLGENFGHVIYESLVSGCPVVLSDRTPWLDLDSVGAGHVASLSDNDKFVSSLEHLTSLDNIDYISLRENSRKFALLFTENDKNIERTKNLFVK